MRKLTYRQIDDVHVSRLKATQVDGEEIRRLCMTPSKRDGTLDVLTLRDFTAYKIISLYGIWITESMIPANHDVDFHISNQQKSGYPLVVNVVRAREKGSRSFSPYTIKGTFSAESTHLQILTCHDAPDEQILRFYNRNDSSVSIWIYYRRDLI